MSEPLKAYNILVTRPAHQSNELCQLIDEQGWNAIRFPTLEIVALEGNELNRQLKKINPYQWVIFVSANAVNFALSVNSGKIDLFKHVSIAAVGKATEKALLLAGLSVDLVPKKHFNSEGLLATEEMRHVKDQSLLIIRGRGGRETLADCLQERGAKVDYMEVYARERPRCNTINIEQLLQQESLSAITITSGDALKNLLLMVAEELHGKLKSVPLIVISSRIKALADNIGFKDIAVTKKPNNTAIIEAVEKMRFLTSNNSTI